MRISYESYEFCTNCNKEIETINVGYPISGDTWICPLCKRTSADVYDNNKGVEHRKRNPIKWYSENEIREAIIKHFFNGYEYQATASQEAGELFKELGL